MNNFDRGFQIGGYYTDMDFEIDNYCTDMDPCLRWLIFSDGEFPRDAAEIEFHICDFRQIERWVKYWGKELRKRGWITEDGDA